MSAASSVICAFTEASSALRSAAGIGRPVSSLRVRSSMLRAQRGQRRAQLVPGVRDELLLQVAGGGEGGGHRVEGAGEPGDLVVGLSSTGMRTARSSVRATCSTASVSLSTGRRPGPGDGEPGGAGADDADPGDQEQDEGEVVEGGLGAPRGGRRRGGRSPGRTCGWVSMLR